MIKLGVAVLVGSFLTGLAVTGPSVIPPSVTPEVETHTSAIKIEQPSAIKVEQLDVRSYGAACSERGWPYFETGCLRDANSPTQEARKVRMVGTDRVPAPR